MPYLPNNAQVFASAFAGALSAFGVRPNGPGIQSDYVQQAEASLALAEAIDTAWGMNSNNAMDFMAIGVSAGLLMRESNTFPAIASYNVAATWTKAAQAIVAAIKSGDVVATDAGITFPDLGSGGGGSILGTGFWFNEGGVVLPNAQNVDGDINLAGASGGFITLYVNSISGPGGTGNASLNTNLLPDTDDAWTIGTANVRVGAFRGFLFAGYQHSGDANPTVSMDGTNGVMWGDGTLAPFLRLYQLSTQLVFDNAAGAGATLLMKGAGILQLEGGYVLAAGVGYYGPGVGGYLQVGGTFNLNAGVPGLFGGGIQGSTGPLIFTPNAMGLGGGGTTTLNATEQQFVIQQWADTLTSNATVIFPSVTGTFYMLDLEDMVFGGNTITVQAGSGATPVVYTEPGVYWLYITGNDAFSDPNAPVLTVSASAPITSTGGVNPVIGITPATSLAPGSMSAADKAKLDAMSIDDVAVSAPITSTGGTTPTIGIDNATDSTDGAMSAADKTKLDGITAGAAVASVGATAPITSTGGTTPNIAITAATDVAAGSMSAADKSKLDVMAQAVFVWNPGGVAGGNVYTSFSSLLAALVPGYLVICDASGGGGLTFPVGSGNLLSGTWQGKTGGETLEFGSPGGANYSFDNVEFKDFNEILGFGGSGNNLFPNSSSTTESTLKFTNIWQGGLIQATGPSAMVGGVAQFTMVTCRNVTGEHTSSALFDAATHGVELFLFDNSPMPSGAFQATGAGAGTCFFDASSAQTFTTVPSSWSFTRVATDTGVLATTVNAPYGATTTMNALARTAYYGSSGSGSGIINLPAITSEIKPGDKFRIVDVGRNALSNQLTVQGNGISVEDPNTIGWIGSSTLKLFYSGFAIAWEYTGSYWKLAEMVYGPLTELLTTSDSVPHTIFVFPMASLSSLEVEIEFNTRDSSNNNNSGGGHFYGAAYCDGLGNVTLQGSTTLTQVSGGNISNMIWRAPTGGSIPTIQYSTGGTNQLTIQAVNSSADTVRWNIKCRANYNWA